MCPQMLYFRVMAFTTLKFTGTIPHVLEDTPLINRQHIHFLQDGAPAHFSRTARRYLDRRLPDRWIGRGGPIAWPPRSPDLNPLDFYLWGHLKSLVYSSPVPDLESLRNRIVACSEDIRNTPGVGIVFAGLKAVKTTDGDAVDSLDRRRLARVWREMEYRVGICGVTNGFTSNMETWRALMELMTVTWCQYLFGEMKSFTCREIDIFLTGGENLEIKRNQKISPSGNRTHAQAQRRTSRARGTSCTTPALVYIISE
ncbi:hypothetical protein ANN_19121 [Periplaneta americana]|uniref:Uncharacterized protein n=1 Tax=Periplaneta americana TaxID=6978 RepID=A0ABQ8S9A0_PERAM|nr:hypothetical protein ANN_19121 [Periplaneta americana]